MWCDEGNGRSGARCKRRYAPASRRRAEEYTCRRGRRTIGSEIGEKLGVRKPLEGDRPFSTTLDSHHAVAGSCCWHVGSSDDLYGTHLSRATASSDLHCLFRGRWPFKMVLRRPEDVATWLQVSRDLLHLMDVDLCLILLLDKV